MRLKEVTINNFRGISEPTKILIDPCITGLIGRNDAGKSSILEALGVYFECDAVKLDKTDFTVSKPNCQIEISCVFEIVNDRVVIDDSNETTLSNEFLLNVDGCLEIKKIYKNAQPANPLIFIVANHPSERDYDDLHQLDNKTLKERADSLEIDISSIDKRKNADLRKAIWTSCSSLKRTNRELDVSMFKGDSEKLHKKIMRLLPLFQLFKVDRESKDNDPVAKNPLQDAVDLAKKELADQISLLEEEIKSKVLDRASRTLEKLKEMDSTLASVLKPKFKSNPKWTFDFTLDGDDNIPINKRGSGVRRLILLNFFRAEAEKRIAEQDAPSVVYAFEEPETSQHPNNQELLLEAFKEIGRKDNSQVMLTTHVPALGAMLPTSGVRYVKKVNGVTKVEYGNDAIIDEIAKSLGVIPLHVSKAAKAIILVEGPSDIDFLTHAANLLKKQGEISSTFEDKCICFLISGGCGTVKHWVTKRLIDQMGLSWGLFMDSDRTSTTNYSKESYKTVENLKKAGHKAYLTRKREIENYLDVSVFNAPPGSIIITDTSDVKNDVNRVLNEKKQDVISKFWHKMDFPMFRKNEKYIDQNGKERFEITEIIKDFLSLV